MNMRKLSTELWPKKNWNPYLSFESVIISLCDEKESIFAGNTKSLRQKVLAPQISFVLSKKNPS